MSSSSISTFFREFRRNFHTTGSILPSSRFLAAELARHVRERGDAAGPRRILEIGPGTGAVTGRILAALGPDDRLDLVELNDEFVAHLRRRLAEDPAWRKVSGQVQVFHQPVESLLGHSPYDRMVSGLPLNNFSVADVERILDVYQRLAAPGARLSYFEYFAIRKFRAVASNPAQRERLRGIGRVTGRLLAEREIGRRLIWFNTPPAWVHHVAYG